MPAQVVYYCVAKMSAVEWREEFIQLVWKRKHGKMVWEATITLGTRKSLARRINFCFAFLFLFCFVASASLTTHNTRDDDARRGILNLTLGCCRGSGQEVCRRVGSGAIQGNWAEIEKENAKDGKSHPRWKTRYALRTISLQRRRCSESKG
jgi:hypothetical protein